MINRIKNSVGESGFNNPQDVGIVQYLLNRVGSRTGETPLEVDGIVGPKTLTSLRNFQKRYCKVVDGRADPGKETIAALNRLAPPEGRANDGVSFLLPKGGGSTGLA